MQSGPFSVVSVSFGRGMCEVAAVSASHDSVRMRVRRASWSMLLMSDVPFMDRLDVLEIQCRSHVVL